jgi:hypothetical protein
MIVISRFKSVSLSPKVEDQIEKEISLALKSIKTVNNEFVVNNTVWYKARGKDKIKPCVVNSADFLSQTFQKQLNQTLGSWYILKI